MKDKITKNFWYLTGISLFFLVTALIGFIAIDSAWKALEIQTDSAGAATVFLLPVYLIGIIVLAFLDFFVCYFTLFAGIIILVLAVIARYLLSPENGHFIGYKVLMGFGYACAVITAIPLALILACLAFPVGAVLAIVYLIFFIKICLKGWKLTFREIVSDVLSFYSDIPENFSKPAILCGTDFIIHTTNSSANQHYKTYNQPEMQGLLIHNFLTDETGAELDRCAEMLKNNDSLERFILTYDENDNPDLTVTAVRQKNKKLAGYLIRHE